MTWNKCIPVFYKKEKLPRTFLFILRPWWHIFIPVLIFILWTIFNFLLVSELSNIVTVLYAVINCWLLCCLLCFFLFWQWTISHSRNLINPLAGVWNHYSLLCNREAYKAVKMFFVFFLFSGYVIHTYSTIRPFTPQPIAEVPRLPRSPSMPRVCPVNHPLCNSVSQLGEASPSRGSAWARTSRHVDGLVLFLFCFVFSAGEHDVTFVSRLTGTSGRLMIVLTCAWEGRVARRSYKWAMVAWAASWATPGKATKRVEAGLCVKWSGLCGVSPAIAASAGVVGDKYARGRTRSLLNTLFPFSRDKKTRRSAELLGMTDPSVACTCLGSMFYCHYKDWRLKTGQRPLK